MTLRWALRQWACGWNPPETKLYENDEQIQEKRKNMRTKRICQPHESFDNFQLKSVILKITHIENFE